MKAPSSSSPTFWQGFRAGAPLWFAAAPFAIAYVVTAREAALNAWQIQFMSLSTYSAATQIVIGLLMIDHASILTILITIMAMNIHHLLYGLSLTGHLQLRWLKRAVVAFPLTDFAYGVTVTQPHTSLSFLLGVEVSVFLAWNFYTGAALFFSPIFTHLEGLRLEFIVPLTFFVLLISAIKRRLDAAVAMFSTAVAVIGYSLGLGNVTILVVCVLGPLFGVGLANFPILKGLR